MAKTKRVPKDELLLAEMIAAAHANNRDWSASTTLDETSACALGAFCLLDGKQEADTGEGLALARKYAGFGVNTVAAIYQGSDSITNESDANYYDGVIKSPRACQAFTLGRAYAEAMRD